MQFEGKVAIVTGAGQGIGEAYAKSLAGEGARVVIAEVNDAQGQRVANEISAAGGEATFVHVDVSSPESTQAMAQATIDAYGGIDFLVNNAAVFKDMKFASMLQVDWDYYKFFMNVNVDGALLMTRACYRSMVERGGGSIVNQSSTAAWMGVGYYGLSKLATNGLTQALARELGPKNIRVNAIAPGPFDTEMMNHVRHDEAKLERFFLRVPMRRAGQEDDIKGAVVFLASDAAAFVTAQTLVVDGGMIAR